MPAMTAHSHSPERIAAPRHQPERARLTRRRLSLDISGSPDVMVRVVMLLRRRRCRVVALDFLQADRHGPGRLELTVLAPSGVARGLEQRLLTLVDVLAVHDLEPRPPGERFSV